MNSKIDHDSNSLSDKGVLYDVMVFKEWLLDESDEDEDLAKLIAKQWDEDKSSKWNKIFPAELSSSKDDAKIFQSLVSLRLPWTFAVTSDCLMIAVAQGEVMEFLMLEKSQNYVPLCRVALPHESDPHLRLLQWSNCSNFLAYTSGNGRVYIFDSSGDLKYSLTSPNLPQWDPLDRKVVKNPGHFCRIFFLPAAGNWDTEMTLVHASGMITTFLLSTTGYQEVSAFSVSKIYPKGVCDAAYIQSKQLLYLAGPNFKTHGLSCWRSIRSELDGDEPFQEVLLQEEDEYDTFFSRILLQKRFGDFAYSLTISPDGSKLATVHISGTICIWSLPSLVKITAISLEEQACSDDINPDFLQSTSCVWKCIYDKNEVKWHPSTLRWWDDQAVVVSRVSGGLTIISIDQTECKTKNLLGNSAEFFSPSFLVSDRFESGFFVLECEVRERKKNIGNKDVKKKYTSKITTEKGLVQMFQTKLENFLRQEDTENFFKGISFQRIYRILYFQSTSPSELYEKKIQNGEYGEAIILARYYSLDCDKVYERQWKLSQHQQNDIADYLSKIQNIKLLAKECMLTIPNSLEATESLLEHGISRLRKDGRLLHKSMECGINECQKILQEFLQRLKIYMSTLDSNEDFKPDEYGVFRSKSLFQNAKSFAVIGNIKGVKAIIETNDRDVLNRIEEIFMSIPEAIDPFTFVSLFDLVELNSTWFNFRARNVMDLICNADKAMNTLSIAESKNFKTDVKFHHLLATYESLTVEKQLFNVCFKKLQNTNGTSLLTMMLQEPVSTDLSTDFKKLAIPFLERVERISSGASKVIISDYITSLAFSPTNFKKGAILIETLINCAHVSWLQPKDILKLGVKAIKASHVDVDLSLVLSLAKKLENHFMHNQEFKTLITRIKGLSLMRHKKINLSLNEFEKSLREKDKAQELISLVISGSIKQMDSKATSFHSELLDVFEIQQIYSSVLSSQECFTILCRALLQSKSEENIKMAIALLVEDCPQTPMLREIRQTLKDYAVEFPRQDDVNKMFFEACEMYFLGAKDFNDRKLFFAKKCVNNFRNGKIKYLFALEAIDLGKTLQMKKNCPPRMLIEFKSLEAIASFVMKYFILQPFNELVKSNVLELAVLIARANSFTEADQIVLKNLMIANLAKSFMKHDRNHKACFNLCQEILRFKIAEGWEACYKMAKCIDKFNDKLFGHSSTFCDSPYIMDILIEKLNQEVRRSNLNEKCRLVPGQTFFDNSLVFQKCPDIEDNIDGTQNYFLLKRSLSTEELECIFIQDPFYAIVVLSCQTIKNLSSDYLRVMKLLEKCYVNVWPSLDKKAIQCTFSQLYNYELSKNSTSLTNILVKDEPMLAMYNYTYASEPSTCESQAAMKPISDIANETKSIDETIKAAVFGDHKMISKYAQQVNDGAPLGLRTLFSNFSKTLK